MTHADTRVTHSEGQFLLMSFNFRMFLFNTEKAESAEMHREEYDFRKRRKLERPRSALPLATERLRVGAQREWGHKKGLSQRLAHERLRRSPLCRAFRLLMPPPCLENNISVFLCALVKTLC